MRKKRIVCDDKHHKKCVTSFNNTSKYSNDRTQNRRFDQSDCFSGKTIEAIIIEIIIITVVIVMVRTSFPLLKFTLTVQLNNKIMVIM